MKSTRIITAIFTVGVLTVAACKDSVEAPNTDQVVAGSSQSLQTLATGAIGGYRVGVATGASFWYVLGPAFARDAIRLDPNDPRFTQEIYSSAPDPADFIGTSGWAFFYADARAIQSLYTQSAFTKLAAGDMAITRGFFNTIEGLDYVRVAETRDSLGIVIAAADPSVLPSIFCKPNGLAAISALLDSAYTDLTAASTSSALPFVAQGFQQDGDFTTRDAIARFNRGLAGEVQVMRATSRQGPTGAAGFSAAVTALDLALADAPSPVTAAYLQEGPYVLFTPSAPESFPNPLAGDTKLGVTDNYANGFLPGDARAANVYTVPTSQQAQTFSFTKSHVATLTTNLAAPLPIQRKGELYLLRAEAKLGLGDLAGARADVNVIHTLEGGLAQYPVFANMAAALSALDYEYRYSFTFQGWQHISFLRRYGLLTPSYIAQTGVPNGGATDPRNQALPIPNAETTARNGDIACH